MEKRSRIVIYFPDGTARQVIGLSTAAEKAGLSESRVRILIRTGKISKSGFGFDYAADYEPEIKKRKTFELTNRATGEVRMEHGYVKAADRIGCSRMALEYAVRKQRGVGNWNIRVIGELK
jgi:hypothetical protein